MAKYTGVVVTQELTTNKTISAVKNYYVQVEAETAVEAKAKAEERFKFWWVWNYNQNIVRENWIDEKSAPRCSVTGVLEGWMEPVEDPLHPVVVEASWRRPYNLGVDPYVHG